MTHFTCYENAEYISFLYFVSEKFAMTVSLKNCALLIKLFLQEQWLCTSSSTKVSETQEYEKRRWSVDCAESVKIDSKV